MKSYTDVPIELWPTSCGLCGSENVQRLIEVGAECLDCRAMVVGYQDDGTAIWTGEGPTERLVRATAVTGDGETVRLATKTCHGREQTIRRELAETFARRLQTEDFRITSIWVEGQE